MTTTCDNAGCSNAREMGLLFCSTHLREEYDRYLSVQSPLPTMNQLYCGCPLDSNCDGYHAA